MKTLDGIPRKPENLNALVKQLAFDKALEDVEYYKGVLQNERLTKKQQTFYEEQELKWAELAYAINQMEV